MKKKILAMCLVVALMATAIVGATLAYFTDTDNVVTNTFSVGKVDITLDEAKVDEKGLAIEDAQRVTANSYRLYPGMTYDKDPMVTVAADSEDCYVRMIMTVSNQAALDAQLADYEIEDILTGFDPDVWVYKGSELKDDVRTYTFWYKSVVTETGALEPLFTHVAIPAELTTEQVAALNEMEIIVKAHAIQAEGFGSQEAAWTAFDATV